MSEKQDITWFWEEMDGDVRQSLTDGQRTAIEDAVRKSAAQTQPADLRLHLGAYFIRIIAGRERRNPERLKQDRRDHPVFVRKNAGLLAVFWIMTLLSALCAIALAAPAVSRLAP